MTNEKPQPKQQRRLQHPEYKSFRLSKKIKHPSKVKISSSLSLIKMSLLVMKKYWKYYTVMTLIYGVFVFLFVRSSSSQVNIVDLKDSFQSILGQSGGLASNIALFGVLIGSASSSSDIAGTYQILLILTFSLAMIHGLRQMFSSSNNQPSVKKSLYQGMTPIIPFILVLLVVGLQLLPLSIGSSLYATVVASGIAVTTLEKALWLILLFSVALLSFYMLSSSIFALYIVTLPEMTPIKALRSARDLVRYRRWEVMRKLLMLPIVLLLLVGLIVVPLIAFVPRIAELSFFLLSLIILPITHTYMYTLYRKLL